MSMDRHFPLRGAENFRDLGGYETTDGRRLRWRQVFRSGRIGGLTSEDVAQLAPLQLATLIDLRTSAEVARSGAGPLAAQARWTHRSLLTPSLTLRPSLNYAEWAVHASAPIADVLRLMSGEQDPFPLVFFCSAGKDRTGVIAALLLTALGVPQAQIVDDYALTRRYFSPIASPSEESARRWQRRMSRLFPDISRTLAQRILDADPATMTRFLSDLTHRYGSPLGYLDTIGIDEARRAVLRARLLEA